MLDVARQYLAAGLNVVALHTRGKLPAVPNLKDFFARFATDEELAQWFGNCGDTKNMGIITGSISRLVVLDLDSSEAVARFESVIQQMSINPTCSLRDTMLVKTGNGMHVYFRYVPAEYDKPPSGHKLWGSTSTKHAEIMLKGEGGYVVGPGSVHPSGAIYESNGKVPRLISKRELTQLVELLKGCNTDAPQKIQDETAGPDPQRASKRHATLEERRAKMIEILRPWYVEGSRNDLAFALSGTMYRFDISLEDGEYYLKGLAEATDDPELGGRLDVLHRTYGLPPEKVAGVSKLRDVFTAVAGPYAAKGLVQGILEALGKELSDRELLILEATDYVEGLHTFHTIQEREEICVYESGVDRTGAKWKIKRLLQARYKGRINRAIVEEVLDNVRRDTYIPESAFDKDLDLINMPNGLYRISTGRLEPHRADYPSLIQTPLPYIDGAKSPLFEKFLGDVLYKEEIGPMLDAMAYSFYRKHLKDVINVLIGKGSNGKTVLIDVLTALHGGDHVGHRSLKDLMENRFAKADLEGKNLNITTETARWSNADTAALKEITTNNRQAVERKGVQAYDAVLWAKMWTSMNAFHDFNDDSDGMIRRLNLFDFPNQFEGDKEDPHLTEKLTTPEELAGIFNLLMPRLKRIIEMGSFEMAKRTIAERREQVSLALDPVGAFVEDMLDEEALPTDMIEKKELYSVFERWCLEKKVPMLSVETFGRAMKGNGYLEKRISGSANKRKRFWVGIRLLGRNSTLTA
jgi:putative DNA primase/helicase